MEADRAPTEARTLVGNLVRDLSQAAVDDLEHALGQVPTGRIQIRAAAARRLFDADIGPLT